MNFDIKKSITTFLILGGFLISPIFAVATPSQIEYQGSTLTKNGQGTRIIFFMKVYEGSLFLENKSSNAEEIVSMNAPMAIRIDVTSAMVTADAMKKALNEALEKSTGNNTEAISKEIIQLSSSFNSEVGNGDYYEFIFLPELGINVLKNSKLIDIIPGLEFKKAFFGIFLSDNPIQKNLKKAMLGG